PAFQVFSKIRYASAREVGRWLMSGDLCMRGEKNGNARRTIVEVWSQAYELENLGIPQPIEADQCSPRATSNGTIGHFFRDLVRLPDEIRPRRRDRDVRVPRRLYREIRSRVAGRFRQGAGIFSDDLDLPRDLFSSKFFRRDRARSRPEPASARIARPVAPLISLPSLGETKCGTFNARRSDRSIRRNGQETSVSFSHSARRAMKSACADQSTPSPIVR